MTAPAHVVGGVRAFASPGVGVAAPRIEYGTTGRWVGSTGLRLYQVHADLCQPPACSAVAVNCVDLAGLCHALLGCLGAAHHGLHVQRTDSGKLCHDSRLFQLAGAVDPNNTKERCWSTHVVLADRAWSGAVVDPTLGPSPAHALTALSQTAYLAAAFPGAQNVQIIPSTLYSLVEHAPPRALEDDVAKRWSDAGLALSEVDPCGFEMDREAPRRGERRLRLQDDALSPADGESADLLLQVVQITPAQLRARRGLRAASAVPPRGAPAKWRATAALRERARGRQVTVSALESGEVLLQNEVMLARIQPLHRDAESARNLAVERAVEAFARSR